LINDLLLLLHLLQLIFLHFVELLLLLLLQLVKFSLFSVKLLRLGFQLGLQLIYLFLLLIVVLHGFV
jgi:hypothetical protein